MGKLGKLLIGIAVLGAIFAWGTNYKVPDGFSDPWALKIFFTQMKIIRTLDDMFEFFGFGGLIQAFLIPKEQPTPASTTKEERFLAGVRTVIYRPKDAQGSLPAMVYYHGGGWIYGSPEFAQSYTVDLVQDLGIAVISVDYRLAPKHPYPAPFKDCYKVTEFVINNAHQLKIDPNRISIGGSSAGGNLAAAVATKFRDEGKGNKIKMQLLLYPALQLYDFQIPSYKENEADGLVKPDFTADAWIQYAVGSKRQDLVQAMIDNTHVTDEARRQFIKLCGNSPLLTKSVTQPTNSKAWNELKKLLKDPYFAPLVAKDLTNMPPSLVVTVEQDLLRDEGFLYVQRLKQRGVQVIHLHIKESFHGIFSFKEILTVDYQRAYDRVLPDLKRLITM